MREKGFEQHEHRKRLQKYIDAAILETGFCQYVHISSSQDESVRGGGTGDEEEVKPSCGDSPSCKQHGEADEHGFLSVPMNILAYVVRQNDISDEAADIPKHGESVPRLCSVQIFAPCKDVKIGKQGSEQPYQEEYLLRFPACLLKPGTDNGHDEIQSQQHIDEPEVSGGIGDVEKKW